jgi:membrane-associated protease RseP (regulator of RpoE activity)
MLTRQIVATAAAAARFGMLIVAVLWPAEHSAALDSDRSAMFAGLRQADARLAETLFRLAVANDSLCLGHVPATGLVLHDLAAYDDAVRPAAARYFNFETPVAVEAVVPDSPAARAGVQEDDSIVAVDGELVAAREDTASRTLDAIDRSTSAGITLTMMRNGIRRTVEIHPIEGCDARGEVKISDDRNAQTDGDIVQVDSGLMNLVADRQEFAAVVAHELAHIVLDHPRRLTAAHVSRGLFKGFGRSARLFKKTENEADRLSVTLMANAGYDPQAAVRYWLTYGPQLNDHGGFGSTHLSWRARAKLIAAAVDRIPRQAPRPIIPAWIDERTQPLR